MWEDGRDIRLILSVAQTADNTCGVALHFARKGDTVDTSTVFGHGIAGVMRGGVGCASGVLGRDLAVEVAAGRVFGNPTRLTGGGPGWDPWQASR